MENFFIIFLPGNAEKLKAGGVRQCVREILTYYKKDDASDLCQKSGILKEINFHSPGIQLKLLEMLFEL
jgi:hypothetical protein